VSDVLPLSEVVDPQHFGGKAVSLGTALRGGLPVPGGYAVSWRALDAAAAVAAAPPELAAFASDVPLLAVRSSAVDEDSAGASFAGTHRTVLGVRGPDELLAALRSVHASATEPAAMAYRRRLGLGTLARMAAVVQELVPADVAGVLFTRDPGTGASVRVIEASWGLGESVVSGLVTPDRFVLDDAGALLEFRPGEKDLAMTVSADGVVEQGVAGAAVESACLGRRELTALHHLAQQCDAVFGDTAHDIEFAFADGAVRLLQRRPITRG
jgi:pyruvate,water dikinase